MDWLLKILREDNEGNFHNNQYRYEYVTEAISNIVYVGSEGIHEFLNENLMKLLKGDMVALKKDGKVTVYSLSQVPKLAEED